MPFAVSGGAKVHFTDTGGDGPVVLLGHGFFMDADMFAAQAQSLAPRYRVIAVDARGHGGTQDSGTPFSYWDLARDSWAVLDELDVDRAVVGGMSQGGFIALRMALLSPPRVDGVVLIGTSDRAYTDKQKVGYREVVDAWTGDAPLVPLAKTMASVMIGGTNDDRQPWLDKWLTGDRHRLTLAGECLINRESITDLVGDITCPAVLVRGVGDQAFSDDDMTGLRDRLGGTATLHTVPGATHAVNVTHPDEVNAVVTKFLDRL